MTEFFKWVTYLGLDQVIVPLVLIGIAAPFTRRCALQCFAAYGIAGLTALAIKLVTPRFRPGFPGDGVVVAHDEQIFLSSFPSGHTVIAFAVAFTLLLSFPGEKRRVVGGIALALASLVGLSRVYRGVHWPTDIAASVLLAWLASLSAMWLFSRGREEASPRRVEELA